MWTVFRPFNHGFSLLYIRNFFPEKSIHPFTEWLFSSEYQRKKVWTLGLFKPSHSDWSLHTATQSFTKAARWPDRVRKKCDNYKMMLNRAFHFGNFRVNAWIAVWRLEKSKCSHRNPLIIISFNALCEGVNPFFGNWNAYTRACVRRKLSCEGLGEGYGIYSSFATCETYRLLG